SLPAEPLIPQDTGNLEIYTWFNDQAIVTIQRAGGIAETAGVKSIEEEHLLLALLRDKGTIFDALTAAQVKLGDLRRQIFQSVQFDDAAPSLALPYSEKVRKLLSDAWKITAAHKGFLSKESMFLAMLNDEDSILQQLLKTMAVDVSPIRQSIEEAGKP
ncbi:MAG TPA: Clp protease N-terminal domain-containing protein, partial [Trichormus sp.]